MRKENRVTKHLSVSKTQSQLGGLRVRTALLAGVGIAPDQNPPPEKVLERR